MTIDSSYLERHIIVLTNEYKEFEGMPEDDITHDTFCSIIIEEIEIVLEQAGKLLKKCLKPYFHSPKLVDELTFKDIFRYAAHHGLLEIEEVDRWFAYRNNRDNTANDSGNAFRENTLPLIPQFIIDAKKIIKIIQRHNGNQG